jgi:hypothetical protein
MIARPAAAKRAPPNEIGGRDARAARAAAVHRQRGAHVAAVGDVQPGDLAQRVRVDALRLPAQQAQAAAIDGLVDEVDVAADLGQVRVGAAEVVLDVAIGALEIAVEAVAEDLARELRRLAQQVVRRRVDRLPARAGLAGEAAGDELVVQEVAALLGIVAIGHLRHEVGRAEQEPELPVLGVGDPDGVERHLVAGVVHQPLRELRLGLEADRRQEFGQELAAARDVAERELGAVAELGLVDAADVADVVEQRADHAEAQRGDGPGGCVRRRARGHRSGARAPGCSRGCAARRDTRCRSRGSRAACRCRYA